MAKKILAAVLAVVVAISAMAVTAFADQKISLIGNTTGLTTNSTYGYTSVDLTFDIPFYAFYQYATPDYYLELTLPTNFGVNAKIDTDGDQVADSPAKITWSVIGHDGSSYSLKPTANTSHWQALGHDADTETRKVYFGFQPHDYVEVGGQVYETTIPQSSIPGDTTSIRLIAHFEFPRKLSTGYAEGYRVNADLFKANGAYGTVVKSQVKKVADDSEVPNSTSFAYQWSAATTADMGQEDGVYQFVTKAFDTASIVGPVDGNGNPTTTPILVHTFSWDHTLENRARLYGAEKVQLVVELNKPLNGLASYNLWGVSSLLNYAGGTSIYWDEANYANRRFIATATLDGPLDKLVFDIPIDALNSSVYDFENVEFAITENILLRDDNILSNRTAYQAIVDANGKVTSADKTKAFDLGKNLLTVDRAKTGAAAGNWGNVTWGAQYGATGDALLYKGSPVVYAYGGDATEYNTTTILDPDANWQTISAVKVDANGNPTLLPISKTSLVVATDVYLNIVEAEADTVEPTTPTEPGDQDSQEELDEGDDITVNDTDDETKEDENPKTGIALAVLPMLVSAAAAVVSKKH